SVPFCLSPSIISEISAPSLHDALPISLRKFRAVLPTEIADEQGIPRKRDRETEIRIYKVLDGEVPTIYEKGLPIVELTGGFRFLDRKSTRLNSSHQIISYAVFCLKKKK